MAHNKLYRNFIILQEDEKKHADAGEKALSGYAKIEAKSDKCKISFYAQNLKENDSYSIVLICYKKDMKQIVDLGTLQVSKVGKGEACQEYYINNIAGLDFSYEKISGAAICKYKDNELSFLMYGFMNGEDVSAGWKKCKVVKHDDKKEKEFKKIVKEVKKIEKDYKKEEKHEEEPCEDKMEHKQKEEPCEDKMEYKNKEEPCEDKIEHKHKEEPCEDKIEHKHKHKEEICEDKMEYKNKEEPYEDIKEYKDKECKDMCSPRSDEGAKFEEYESIIDKIKEEILDPYDFDLRGSGGKFFNDIASGFEETRNKYKDLKYCKWYKVKVNSLDDMCNISNYNKYTVAYYPMLNYYPYIRKYGHFMLGYKCDSKGNLKYIVYGVPGKKGKEEQPYLGKTGFVTWMDVEGTDVGCWLMFYDYKNSIVVVPAK
ncbi:hypothetical protein [Clostridium vincentii]|uniref:Transmembrane protein n=1 Tax=Clostridium vincentii TaxID=52704 RepID=A0A2T0BHJ8_9CLOT|nr:hypothetical protein [Clostridium vincentii]PRR83297.1 hypothetical protein CLVI_10960 [Clostridium vincentii]